MPNGEFSTEDYFQTQPEPSSLASDVAGVRDFIQRQVERGRRVVLVTSGGTTVPLELNVVRFLDNFSAGTRGATSAEYFLRAGYAVIFMHRQFSLQPFSRHYSHSTNPFLDYLSLADPSDPSCTDVRISAPSEADRTFLANVLRARQHALNEDMLHTLTFVSVNDYLFLLRGVSEEMAKLGRRSMYYLAAAVSDFFLPRQKMSEHKIQSRKGSLIIEMDQVPKVLKPMVENWIPESFVVSFKLETDPTLLIPKASASLERYGHQVVIGNVLDTRKFEVVFVSPASSSSSNTTTITPAPSTQPPTLTPFSSPFQVREEWIRLPGAWVRGDKGGDVQPSSPLVNLASASPEEVERKERARKEVEKARSVEIEEVIVDKLVSMHRVWLGES